MPLRELATRLEAKPEEVVNVARSLGMRSPAAEQTHFSEAEVVKIREYYRKIRASSGGAPSYKPLTLDDVKELLRGWKMQDKEEPPPTAEPTPERVELARKTLADRGQYMSDSMYKRSLEIIEDWVKGIPYTPENWRDWIPRTTEECRWNSRTRETVEELATHLEKHRGMMSNEEFKRAKAAIKVWADRYGNTLDDRMSPEGIAAEDQLRKRLGSLVT
jgi:hypothetical protein